LWPPSPWPLSTKRVLHRERAPTRAFIHDNRKSTSYRPPERAAGAEGGSWSAPMSGMVEIEKIVASMEGRIHTGGWVIWRRPGAPIENRRRRQSTGRGRRIEQDDGHTNGPGQRSSGHGQRSVSDDRRDRFDTQHQRVFMEGANELLPCARSAPIIGRRRSQTLGEANFRFSRRTASSGWLAWFNESHTTHSNENRRQFSLAFAVSRFVSMIARRCDRPREGRRPSALLFWPLLLWPHCAGGRKLLANNLKL
jgi:hypothetical protein